MMTEELMELIRVAREAGIQIMKAPLMWELQRQEGGFYARLYLPFYIVVITGKKDRGVNVWVEPSIPCPTQQKRER